MADLAALTIFAAIGGMCLLAIRSESSSARRRRAPRPKPDSYPHEHLQGVSK